MKTKFTLSTALLISFQIKLLLCDMVFLNTEKLVCWEVPHFTADFFYFLWDLFFRKMRDNNKKNILLNYSLPTKYLQAFSKLVLPFIFCSICRLTLHQNEIIVIQERTSENLSKPQTENVFQRADSVWTNTQTHMWRSSFCFSCFLLSVISQRNMLHFIKSPETINHMKSVICLPLTNNRHVRAAVWEKRQSSVEEMKHLYPLNVFFFYVWKWRLYRSQKQ